jgi:hypothetical protein
MEEKGFVSEKERRPARMRETTKRTRPGIEACPPAAIRMFFFFESNAYVLHGRIVSVTGAQTTYRDLVYYQARVT